MDVPNDSPQLLRLVVPGLSENRPSLLRGDRIYAKVYPTASSEKPDDKEYEGVVHQVHEKHICVGFSKELQNRLMPLKSLSRGPEKAKNYSI
jgi:helicase MOV-10